MFDIINILISLGLLLLAVPTGILIAKMTKDELKQGKKWFRILIILSVITGIGALIYGSSVIAWTCGFIFIVSLVSYMKSGKR